MESDSDAGSVSWGIESPINLSRLTALTRLTHRLSTKPSHIKIARSKSLGGGRRKRSTLQKLRSYLFSVSLRACNCVAAEAFRGTASAPPKHPIVSGEHGETYEHTFAPREKPAIQFVVNSTGLTSQVSRLTHTSLCESGEPGWPVLATPRGRPLQLVVVVRAPLTRKRTAPALSDERGFPESVFSLRIRT